MRKVFIFSVLLLNIAATTVAQTGRAFYLDKLSKNDTLLTGWLFHTGDNPEWANPSFDDHRWQATDPGQDITGFDALKKAGIGWVRLHLSVDSSLANQQLTCWVLQYTASEIYLNGKLIKKYGTITSDPYNTRAFCPTQELIKLNLKPGADQVIAVKLGYEAGIPYISPFFTPLSAFKMYVNNFEAAFDNHQQNQQLVTNGAIFVGSGAGIFLIISIIYLAYFIFDPLQRLNLYYSLFSLCIFLVCSMFVEFVGNIESVSVQMLTDVFDSFFFEAGFLFMLLTIYVLFDYKARVVFKWLILIAAAGIICLFFWGTLGFIFCSNVFSILCFVEGARVSILAIKRKKKGAVIILFWMILSIIFQVWSGLLDQATLLSLVLAVLSFAGFPFGMAIYLGIEYAVTNQNLRISLADVQTLSAQNLSKEQEKQQILADQNLLLEHQVTERTAELNRSLTNLQMTQSQLIQSEKMASLGELTAGIAHEIQNPLNFVNNFSEVSIELIDEMEGELLNGDKDEAIAIAGDVKQNLEKIRHHGKRADSIVKGMLQHSRTNSGEKQLTNINNLADEFMKLSYHGLRAKDKSFNTELVTDFDNSLPQIKIAQQDIGRVLLNLFNNAFYAVQQKAKTTAVGYKPVIMVKTFAPPSGGWGVAVRDNGTGIPDALKDKILQPFFTTKPTGEGTGLGLSLSYDIVVKGHGGSVNVNSVEGEYTEFIIYLPVQ